MSAEIQAAFFGVVCRAPESRVNKNGKPFVQFFCRIGDGEDAPLIACVRASRAETAARAARYSVGTLIFAEGVLFLNKKVGADGAPTIVLDLQARHLRVVDLCRQRPIADPASPPAEVAS